MLLSNTIECNDLPPGFEGNCFMNKSKADLSYIPCIKWECAPQFTFCPKWRLAAGEQSREKVDQKHRERRVLEAVYPRLSSVPTSPSVSFQVEQEDYDDNLTPLIPITEPIDEEEDVVDITPEVAATKPFDSTTNLQSQNLQLYTSAKSPFISQGNASSAVPSSACGRPVPVTSPGSEQDLTAAVIAAVLKRNDQGNLIDTDLLVKIFNDPILIEKLIKEQTSAAAATVSASSNSAGIPTSGLSPATPVPVLKPTSTATSAVGLLASMSKQATASPTLGMPTGPSFSLMTSALHKPAGISTTPSFIPPTTPLPASASAPHKHMHVNTNIHHMSDAVLHTSNTHPSQRDSLSSYGTRLAAPFPPVSSIELSTMPSATVNLHASANQVGSTASTVAYQPSIGSCFTGKKDTNYYKNLIKQHGADKNDKPDSQIGIHHNNLEEFKPVYNIKTGEMVFKNQKPCIYFNTPRGCRKGIECPFQHDVPVKWGAGNNILDAPNAKRFKLGPEINGRI